MKNIRQGVFETNSSSTHSITLGPNNDSIMDTLPLDFQGNVVLLGGEFGWEICNYKDANSKASYAAIYALDWSGAKSEEFVKTLKDTIVDQTGCKDVIFDFSTDWSVDMHETTSYIDHQSVEDNDLDYLFEDPELLRNFIFNKNSVLRTDNDNN